MPFDRDGLRRNILDLMRQSGFMPLRKRALARKLGVPEEDYRDFRHLVDELAEKGELAERKHGKFSLPASAAGGAAPGSAMPQTEDEDAPQAKGLPRNALVGRIEIKRGGFGFVLSEPPGNDTYISGEDLGGALNGDLVAALPKRSRHGRRSAGRVIRVLERAHPLIVGTFHSYRPAGPVGPHGAGGFVTPDARGLFEEIDVLPSDRGAAQEGDKVAIELLEAGANLRSGMRPTGRVTKVYGEAGEARAELDAVIQNFRLRTEFQPEALREASEHPDEVPQAELEERVDHTGLLTFTIDPQDAQDHDDAVSLRSVDGERTELLVHIADVSHYVPEDTALDREARTRGTSVYLPGLTLPMLPPRLSNGLCSLHAGPLRLAKTVVITYSKNLVPEETRIERSFIRSAATLTYSQVRQAIDEHRAEQLPSREIFGALKQMKSFAQALRRKRLAAGAIDLDLPEVRLKLDQDGRMVGWEKEEHDWSHQLIEDFMLAANRAVAEYLVAHEVLGLFRVHEEPDTGDLKQFAEFLSGFGLVLRPPYDRHKLKLVLDRVRGKDYQHAVHLALLTSLKQAHYSAECRPHYALNFTRYLHFTSPIRRYPDLIVHRALDECFQPEQKALPARGKKRRGAMGEEAYYRRLASLRQLAVHCSERERGADDAEEEYAKVLQIQYLRQHRRESHAGVIVRVTEKGLIVEMQDCYVEGFLAVEDLGDDRFEYVSQRHLLQGRRTRRSFRLGDKLSVRVSFIDVGARKVGLGLVET